MSETSWLWQNVASTILTASGSGLLIKLLQFLINLFRRYSEFSKEALHIQEGLDEIQQFLTQLGAILNDNEFNCILETSNPEELMRVTKRLKSLDSQRTTIEEYIQPFLQVEDTGRRIMIAILAC